MKVCLLLLVSIIFVVVVHGDDDDMMRRKQYLKMVKLRKNQMEASREAFEKSTTDTESIDTGSTKESIRVDTYTRSSNTFGCGSNGGTKCGGFFQAI